MIKGGVFIFGLATGLYLGVKFRENGYSTAITKGFYTVRNHGSIKTDRFDENMTFDILYQMYLKNILNPESREKFEKIINNRDYSNVEEIVLCELNDLLNDPDIKRAYRNSINSLYKN